MKSKKIKKIKKKLKKMNLSNILVPHSCDIQITVHN